MKLEGKTIDIDQNDFISDGFRERLHLGSGFCEVFGDPRQNKFSLYSPMHTYLDAINWCWLEWHRSESFALIHPVLSAVSRRSANAFIQIGNIQQFSELERGSHDRMLLACAILSGNIQTMAAAANVTKLASGNNLPCEYDMAIAGILACRILNDSKSERIQLEISEHARRRRDTANVSNAVARQFVERDYTNFCKTIGKEVKKYWNVKWHVAEIVPKYQKPFVLSEDERSAVINVRAKTDGFLWPYLQATFAKLAMMDGAIVALDNFWFPVDFIKAEAR